MKPIRWLKFLKENIPNRRARRRFQVFCGTVLMPKNPPVIRFMKIYRFHLFGIKIAEFKILGMNCYFQGLTK